MTSPIEQLHTKTMNALARGVFPSRQREDGYWEDLINGEWRDYSQRATEAEVMAAAALKTDAELLAIRNFGIRSLKHFRTCTCLISPGFSDQYVDSVGVEVARAYTERVLKERELELLGRIEAALLQIQRLLEEWKP
jgi:hypothetical protein